MNWGKKNETRIQETLKFQVSGLTGLKFSDVFLNKICEVFWFKCSYNFIYQVKIFCETRSSASPHIAPSRSQIIHMYSVQQHSPALTKDLLDIDEQPHLWSADAFACARTGKKLCATQQQEHVCFLIGSLSHCNLTGNTFPAVRLWYIWEQASQTAGHIYI